MKRKKEGAKKGGKAAERERNAKGKESERMEEEEGERGRQKSSVREK